MQASHLPIFRITLSFCVYTEEVVKKLDRYYRYTLGADLRDKSKEILFLIHHASINKLERLALLRQLRDKTEEMKVLIMLFEEMRAFHSFQNFEYLSRQIVEICKQAQAWLNKTRASL